MRRRAGALPFRVTRNGGGAASESWDGRTLYLLEGPGASRQVLAMPLDGGEERVISLSRMSSVGTTFQPRTDSISSAGLHLTRRSGTDVGKSSETRTRSVSVFPTLTEVADGKTMFTGDPALGKRGPQLLPLYMDEVRLRSLRHRPPQRRQVDAAQHHGRRQGRHRVRQAADDAGRILGVKNYPDSQIVFVDTPGIHRPLHR